MITEQSESDSCLRNWPVFCLVMKESIHSQAIEKQHQFLLFSEESFESDFDPKLHLKF